MAWGSVGEFFAMGGYGLYVWGAYGVTVLLLAGEVALIRRRCSSALAQARRLARAGSER